MNPVSPGAPSTSFASARAAEAPFSDADRAVLDTVRAFAAAADARDVASMEGILDQNFRIAFTLKSSREVSTLDRATYLSLLREGKVGGVAREVQVVSIAVNVLL